MPKFSSAQKQAFFFACILLSLIPFHWRSFFMGPMAIHLWAAADWYALALGFLDNGMDFFHPQVNQLNLQFPGSLSPDELQGITSVDFPLNPYIVAWGMKLLGTNSPMVYRTYTLLLSLVGLFFLFKAAFLRTHSFGLAAFLVVFVRFQPSYAYYMDGFMPTQNALSTFFIALYFLSSYSIHHKNRTLIFAVLFMSLAGLMRLPFTIPLIALFGTFFLTSVCQKKLYLIPLMSSFFGLLVIMLYFLYNKSLSFVYGSVFLNEIMPPRNVYDFVFYWVGGILKNSVSVLPAAHLFMCILLSILLFRKYETAELWKNDKGVIVFVAISLIGAFMYSLLMARQLWAHDYYFNDFFLPVLLLYLLWALGKELYPSNKIRQVVLVLFLASAFQTAFLWQKSAYTIGMTERPEIISTYNFDGADTFLDELQVSGDATLLVVGTFAPSIPGNATHRKCFGVRIPEKNAISVALSLPFDYIITQNNFYKDVLEVYPDWERETKPVATNGKITLHLLRSSE